MATVRHLGLFPFCSSSYPPDNGLTVFDVGEFTQYPFTLSVIKACELWWRVKAWRLSFTYAQFIDLHLAGDAPVGSFAEILPTPVVLGSKDSEFNTLRGTIENEKSLVCLSDIEAAAQYYIWSWTAVRSFFIASDPPSSGSSVVTFQAAFATNWDTQQLGFAPPFVAQEDPQKKELWTAFFLEIAEFSTLRSDDAVAEGLFAIGPPDQLTEKVYPIGSNVIGPGYSSSLTGLEVRAIEYFPYTSGEGPIYDTDTGRQLRAFPH